MIIFVGSNLTLNDIAAERRIYVSSNLTISIASDNGLSPVRRRTIL